MERSWLQNLIDAIVAEVVRRVAEQERQKQHPEQVMVLLAGPVAYPEKLEALLEEQFGVGYTQLCLAQQDAVDHSALLSQASAAKTVILVSPRLELLQQIAEGRDESFPAYLMVRSILWKKDVRLYLDFEPPRFRRNTFMEGVAASIETLREMGVTVCPYYRGDAAALIGASLITEADVLSAAQNAEKTIYAKPRAIITPAARDALLANDVAIHYGGETECS